MTDESALPDGLLTGLRVVENRRPGTMVIGRPELADDERFATPTAHGESQDALDAMVAEWASGHTAVELDRIVNEA